MTSMEIRSFDGPRDRFVPTSLSGHWSTGESVNLALSSPTLIVAVKQDCEGCRGFVLSDLDEFVGLRVIVVSATEDVAGQWRGAPQPVLIAPEFLRALEIRWPPFYVLIDPDARRVLVEGVVFGPSQVAQEVHVHLDW